ncbi:MAG TPA: 23S rRNA (uracil(1939)-C(5))-methyltransferase RlmD [Solirubrobacteraceae bacterium]
MTLDPRVAPDADAPTGLSPAPGVADGADAPTPRPQRGDELELSIDSLAFGGEGVARLGDGGYVVFVAGAIPGDRVRAVVHKRKRSYAHARAVEILEPSPERIAPRADHPGVPWQVLPYERQLLVKRTQVDDALRRIGRLDGYELEEIVPALEQWRYRNKLEYSFGGGPAGSSDVPGSEGSAGEGLVCGFHAPAGGNSVVAIEDCLLASERGNLARETALAWCRAQGLSAWERGRGRGGRSDEDGEPTERVERAGRAGRVGRVGRVGPDSDGRARLRNLVVREGRRTGKLQIRIVTTDGELEAGALAQALRGALGESLAGVLWTRSRSLAETTAGGDTELVWGEAELPERLGDLDLRISPEAFFQTNTEMAELLYGVVVEYAALEGWERVYDLYSGIGTIALTLAARAGELWGIELVEEAVADAIAAARRNEIQGVQFFAGDTRLALPELVQRAGRPDVLVVDPPRAGLSQKVVRRIIEASPKRIVYVSCNPTTLAPNAAQLEEAGWKLVKVRPVDMFPQTHHIECVALFERRPGAPAPVAVSAAAEPEVAATDPE